MRGEERGLGAGVVRGVVIWGDKGPLMRGEERGLGW